MKHQLKRIKKNKQILSNKNLLEIGLLVGVHGIKGEVKLKSYTEIPENIFNKTPISHIQIPSSPLTDFYTLEGRLRDQVDAQAKNIKKLYCLM